MSDNGTQFTSAEFSNFLKQRGIVHLKSSLYYPCANGEVERFNRVLKDCLPTASIQGTPWKPFTRPFLMDYRATPNSTTGVSPSQLLHGRQMRIKLQIIDMTPVHVKENVVRERVRKIQEYSKQYTDRKRSVRKTSFKPGDQVRIRKPWTQGKGNKSSQSQELWCGRKAHTPTCWMMMERITSFCTTRNEHYGQ